MPFLGILDRSHQITAGTKINQCTIALRTKPLWCLLMNCPLQEMPQKRGKKRNARWRWLSSNARSGSKAFSHEETQAEDTDIEGTTASMLWLASFPQQQVPSDHKR